MLLKEMKGKSLVSWSTEKIYSMELFHGLGGFFPVITEAQQTVVALDRAVLQKIWEKLDHRKIIINKGLALVNKKEKILLPLNTPRGENVNSDNFFLVLEEDVSKCLKEKHFFQWPPGFSNLKDEDKATFPVE